MQDVFDLHVDLDITSTAKSTDATTNGKDEDQQVQEKV